eukprot:4807759-Prymnesium_polylepis.1
MKGCVRTCARACAAACLRRFSPFTKSYGEGFLPPQRDLITPSLIHWSSGGPMRALDPIRVLASRLPRWLKNNGVGQQIYRLPAPRSEFCYGGPGRGVSCALRYVRVCYGSTGRRPRTGHACGDGGTRKRRTQCHARSCKFYDSISCRRAQVRDFRPSALTRGRPGVPARAPSAYFSVPSAR